MSYREFYVCFQDDHKGVSNISVYAHDENDARELLGRCFAGRRGSGTFRLATERGEEIPFQIGRGDTQDGDAA